MIIHFNEPPAKKASGATKTGLLSCLQILVVIGAVKLLLILLVCNGVLVKD